MLIISWKSTEVKLTICEWNWLFDVYFIWLIKYIYPN